MTEQQATELLRRAKCVAEIIQSGLLDCHCAYADDLDGFVEFVKGLASKAESDRISEIRDSHNPQEDTMLLLNRKPHESIRIGDDIVLTVGYIRGQIVQIGIEAPKDVPVVRSELLGETEEDTPPDGK